MGSDLISVIIPAYNVEAMLERMLESILAQTYQNLEIIVVDDGSTDATASVVARYEARYPCIRGVKKQNGGVTSARLKGVEYAHGDWISFVDADDCIEPWMYERLLDNAKKYNAEISHCGYQMCLPSGKTRYYYDTGRIVVQDNESGLKDLLEGAFVEPGLCNKLISRRIIEAALDTVSLEPTIRNLEDLLMNYYFFREANCSVYEDVCPYHYIVRKESAANAPINLHQLLDPLRVKRILLQETSDNEKLYRIAESQFVQQLISLSTLDVKENAEITKPVRTDARKELRRMVPRLIRGTCAVKVKLKGLWVSVLPGLYASVHRIYARLTGIDKIYE